jgi:hypothetical protein
MNFNTLKNLISSHTEWELESITSNQDSILFSLTLPNGLEVLADFSVRSNGIISNIEVRKFDYETQEEDILVEGNDAFSKNDDDLEMTLFTWLKKQVQYGLEEIQG